jgi:hypothetical protein
MDRQISLEFDSVTRRGPALARPYVTLSVDDHQAAETDTNPAEHSARMITGGCSAPRKGVCRKQHARQRLTKQTVNCITFNGDTENARRLRCDRITTWWNETSPHLRRPHKMVT